MKIRAIGSLRLHQKGFSSKEYATLHRSVLLLYRKNRENGNEVDNPTRDFPHDGSYDWKKQEGNYYCMSYHEGPSDKAWMEEKDKKYLARIECDGNLKKLEPEVWYLRQIEKATNDICDWWAGKLKLPNIDEILAQAEQKCRSFVENAHKDEQERFQPVRMHEKSKRVPSQASVLLKNEGSSTSSSKVPSRIQPPSRSTTSPEKAATLQYKKSEIGQKGEQIVYDRLKKHFETKYGIGAQETDTGFRIEGEIWGKNKKRAGSRIEITVEWYGKQGGTKNPKDLTIRKILINGNTGRKSEVERIIEVKSTESMINKSHFSMSPAEYELMKECGDNYRIFRVFDVLKDPKIQKIRNPAAMIDGGAIKLKRIEEYVVKFIPTEGFSTLENPVPPPTKKRCMEDRIALAIPSNKFWHFRCEHGSMTFFGKSRVTKEQAELALKKHQQRKHANQTIAACVEPAVVDHPKMYQRVKPG